MSDAVWANTGFVSARNMAVAIFQLSFSLIFDVRDGLIYIAANVSLG